jgi:hypothetical protein
MVVHWNRFAGLGQVHLKDTNQSVLKEELGRMRRGLQGVKTLRKVARILRMEVKRSPD